jgi:hypothetical protein
MKIALEVYFITDRVYSSSEDGKTFRIERPLMVKIEGNSVTVPLGFETDLDSVPRLPLAYWLAKGRAFKSAILHDFMYYEGYPREFCDDVMYGGMVAEGVSNFWRDWIYAGVRAGGWKAYNEHRKRDAARKRGELMESP